ncbi:type I polyketide synthase [Wenjunlia tyrosinilytica]|uniref:Uncharacterized protein n=1 Tax=Wenjunlia tyrosinilytica TaxID=1544741 RepID=A0A917ZUI2_9ACTN|nr:type I polyketide synthase [Wenjunlia tyrosinilytica]GGO96048.1 hypothetical protein GCM10012280_54680 [Wenjunlia tyrosinilytica]
MNNQPAGDDGVQPIAVIGMAGRFPGAADPEAFWRNIAAGVESLVRLSEDDLIAARVPEERYRDPHYVRAATVLDGMDRFDAGYFGFTPMEASILDPQHRLLLECTQELFDTAGYDSCRLDKTTGVYVGVGFPSYLVNNLLARPEIIEQVGMQRIFFATDKGFAPTRISHKFDLTGPSIGVDTACSTSLVAVHQACRALLAYDCDLAIAGGASSVLPNGVGYQYHEGGISSLDGHCRAFDARAGGTRFGSGVGLVLLKRLEDALADGDQVLAVIRGSAVNNDGASKAGFTAPSATGQALVVAEALAFAEVSPDSVGYVEAHGTGTVIGDPIEISGLTRAFRKGTDRRQYCAIGSVKTNVGHLDVAAGVSGLIKTVQALRHAELPPSLHCEQPNPAIDFASSPFYVNTELRPWTSSSGPRRAGVSSFGIGGTNAHVVLEEAPPRGASGPSRAEHLVVVSARSAEALDRARADLAAAFRNAVDEALPDLAFTLSVGRRAHAHRQAFVCRTRAEAVDLLEGARPSAVRSGMHTGDAPRIAFLFPGQGAQQVRMLADLQRGEEVFRREVERCAMHVEKRLGLDMCEVIYPVGQGGDARLDETWLTQPALFAVSLATARLWQSWGVQPDVLLGHSLGEYVAATVAEVFGPEDALDLVIDRARLMNGLPAGAMTAVSLDAAALEPLLGQCSLAAVNAPGQCVASGPLAAVEELEARMAAAGVVHRRLRTSHAFHSAMLDEVAGAYRERVAQARPGVPRTPIVSCLTGRVLEPGESSDPAYWARQMRGTVRFAEAVRTIAEDPHRLFLEVGPGRTLTSMVRRSGIAPERALASARGDGDSRTDGEALLDALGALHCAGAPVAWERFWAGERRHRLPLPSYPFERQRHWIDPNPAERPALEIPAASRDGETLSARTWRPAPLDPGPSKRPAGGDWLLLVADDALGCALEARLAQRGASVVRIRPGVELAETAEEFVVDPARPDLVERLLEALEERGRTPSDVVLACDRGAAENVDAAQRAGLETAAVWIRALASRATGEPVRLAVVADRLARVLPSDEPATAMGSLVGFCRAAAEHPELAVACIDIDEPSAAEAADAVLAELTAGPADALVAYRSGRRHIESYEPVARAEGGARASGSYLVTGGYDGLSAILARRLAERHGARLTLAGPEPVPPRTEWPGWFGEDTGVELARGAAEAEAGVVTGALRHDVEALSDVERELAAEAGPGLPLELVGATLNRLCGSYVHGTLLRAGVDLTEGQVYKRSEIARRMRILPIFEKFLDFFLEVLHEDGVIRREGDRIEVLIGPEAVPPADSVAARALLPGFEATIDFLEHCVAHYPAALSGDIDAIGVLFPEGDPKPLEAAFRRLLDGSNFDVYAGLLGRLLARLPEGRPGRPLRILEVGGGNGQLTRLIAPMLSEREVEYRFTDLGGSFVRRAREELADLGFGDLRCQILDITKDPVAQGFEPYSFDAVIGFDVVHATRRIDRTSENLRGLLAPGGLLCLVEAVASLRWVEMLWGLAEGWWLFEDHEVRTGSPLVPLDTWDRVLGELPFADTVSFPRDRAARESTYYGLVLAQQPEVFDTPDRSAKLARRAEEILQINRTRIQAVRDLEAAGAEVLLVRVDLTSPVQVAEAVATARTRFGALDGVVHAPETVGGEPGQDWTPASLRALAAAHGRMARAVEAAAADTGVESVTYVSLDAAPGGGDALRAATVAGLLDAFAASGGAGSRSGSIHWNGDEELNQLDDAIGSSGVIHVSAQSPAAARAAGTDRQRAWLEARGTRGDPAEDVERELLVIFQQLFGMDAIGLDDDFYQLGGDSLLAVQVVARVRRRFGVDIAVKAVLQAPTVARLAQRVRATGQGGQHTDTPLLRVPRHDLMPLSFGQESLWLAEELHGPSATYNIPGAVRLIGRLETGALRRSLRQVIQRHEVLRTTIHAVDGLPGQRVHDELNVELPVRDVREEQISDLAQEHARTVFDLTSGPLIRVTLLRVGPEDHVLLVNIHHIVSDGWSLGVLVEELVTLYSAFVRGGPSPLERLDHQYVDFAQWQRRWLEGEVFDRQLAFWRRKLAGAPSLLELPTDRPRPEIQRIHNAVRKFVVPPEVSADLVALGRAEGATLFMVLLAAFKVLLARYSERTDIIVGTTSANRTRAVFEQMIGMFVNNLALRTDLSGNPTFRELLARVRDTAVDAYAHQDLPFRTLVDELRQDRSTAVTPVFQVLFLLQKLNITLELPGITAHTLEVDALHTKFDLTLFMEEQENGIEGTFIYNAELFDEPTVERMAAHLRRLLVSAVAAPDIRIESLRMATDDEERVRHMAEASAKTSMLQSLHSAKRRSVEIAGINPVTTGFLPGLPDTPLVVEPAVVRADLPGWLRSHRGVVDSQLHRHGALLFRGFHGGSVEKFEEVAHAICATLYREYGDLPREGDSVQVYKSTPYPSDRSILFHNESSHLSSWPMRQLFSCIVAPQDGGETPVVDCRKVYAGLRPELIEMFRRRRLRYVRNFIESVDVSWSQFYGTDDRAFVERKCREEGTGFEWALDGTLRTWRVADAVVRHPRTGEMVFFNQLALHHASCLDPDTRRSLGALYGEQGMPRNVYWGDGSLIEDEVVAEVRELMDREAITFRWQEGDVLVIDNMLVAHSRLPFVGPRKIVVALGDMMEAETH